MRIIFCVEMHLSNWSPADSSRQPSLVRNFAVTGARQLLLVPAPVSFPFIFYCFCFCWSWLVWKGRKGEVESLGSALLLCWFSSVRKGEVVYLVMVFVSFELSS